jgi:perosamine synthetase
VGGETDRRAAYDALRAAGVGVQVHYVPIYRHPIFADVNAAAFPHTESAYAGLLSLPLFPDLSDGEQDVVIEKVAEVLS